MRQRPPESAVSGDPEMTGNLSSQVAATVRGVHRVHREPW